MAFLFFNLSGDMAMWRNPYESMGSFSSLGPAPSNIAGLLGAALGFPSPRSLAAGQQDSKKLKDQMKKGLPWPVSPELLKWEHDNDYHVACRWTGGTPYRMPWNVNGVKEISKGDNLRLQQQVIEKPSYDVLVKLNREEADRSATALKNPAFPLFLGASFCRAIVKNIDIMENIPDGGNWAMHKQYVFGEATPFTRHVINAEETFERVVSDGYWVYPEPSNPGEILEDPLVKGYCFFEKK
ncbi:MAG: CRISPR-associated protein (Cas_Cas5) [Smithella sp. PtaU1.Bin162]|nr:MAG: CRISPR-associated protein (Cas_Cas5) [Smithella sp. PtaU1.Bin162]